jgi:acid phosphatase class B
MCESKQNLLNDSACDIREPIIATCVSISQSLMIQTSTMQHRCVQIMGMDLSHRRLDPILVGFSIDDPTLDSSTSHPRGKNQVVMFSPGVICRLMERSSTELGRPNHQRSFEHSASLQVLE